MNESWEIVEYAMIAFISWLNLDCNAIIDDQHNVMKGIMNHNMLIIMIESMTWIISSLNWIAMNNPVITNVDECNKAEIVVGAFIELINHDAIGSWADLLKIIKRNEHALPI